MEYPELVSSPGSFTEAIRDFFGTDVLPQADEMPSVVKPDLYRSRTTGKELS